MQQTQPSPLRLLLFIGAVIVVAIVLIALPESLQSLLFIAILAPGVLYGLSRANTKFAISFNILQTLREIRHRHANIMARISMGIACVFALIAAYYFYPPFEYPGDIGFRYSILSFFAIGISQWLKPIAFPQNDVVEIADQPINKIRWRVVAWGIMCIALLTQINVLIPHYDQYPLLRILSDTSVHLQMLLLIAGAVLIGIGFSGEDAFRLRDLRFKRHHYLLGFLFLFALIVRLWNLEYDFYRPVDELSVMRSVIEMDAGDIRILTQQSILPLTWIPVYFQWLYYEIFGPSFSSMRVLSAAMGSLSILVVYLLARSVFSRRVGLLSAAILATLPVHIHLSRIGIHNIADPMFGVSALTFLVYGLRSRQQRYFVVAGILLGFTHFSTEAGRLFFTLFTFCWLAWIFIFARRDTRFTFPSARNLILFILCLTLIAVPVYLTWMGHNLRFTKRLDTTRVDDIYLEAQVSSIVINKQEALIGHIAFPLQRYVHIAGNDWFYTSDFSYVLPLLVPFFLIGIALSIRRLLQLDGSLLVWSLLGVAIANVVLISEGASSASPRYVVVFPIIAVVIAIGINAVWERLVASLFRSTNALRVGNILSLLVVTSLVIYQLDYYYRIYNRDIYYEKLLTEQAGAPDDAVIRAINLPPNTDVHIVSRELVGRALMGLEAAFWGRVPPDLIIMYVESKDFNRSYIEELDFSRNQAFFIDPGNERTRGLIHEFFPQVEPEYSPFDVPQEVQMPLYFVPASAPSAP